MLQIFLAGCTLHIVHNAAKKVATHMPPFEAVFVDIFHFFDNSCERKGRFQQMQALFDVEHKKKSSSMFLHDGSVRGQNRC